MSCPLVNASSSPGSWQRGGRYSAARSGCSRRPAARSLGSRRMPSGTGDLPPLRTGMLCRFGWSDDSRPVRATVWLNVAWIRPSEATSCNSPSPYVPRSLSTSRWRQQRGEELRPLVLKLLERCGVGRGAGLRLLDRRQALLFVQQLAQLLRRVEVEVGHPRRLMRSSPTRDSTSAASLPVHRSRVPRCRRRHRRVPSWPAPAPAGSRSVSYSSAIPCACETRAYRPDEVVDCERVPTCEFGVGHRCAVKVEPSRTRRVVRRTSEFRVLLDQVGQVVTHLSRVDEICSNRSVEGQSHRGRPRRRAATASAA